MICFRDRFGLRLTPESKEPRPEAADSDKQDAASMATGSLIGPHVLRPNSTVEMHEQAPRIPVRRQRSAPPTVTRSETLEKQQALWIRRRAALLLLRAHHPKNTPLVVQQPPPPGTRK
jgi:hypothetical protein